ncbi:fucolectin-4 isoform X2 [Lingula anatina]|uniref:Fucolectin-4 isoform X2 n=1 Tax=Lingula anatina TaxID=7574 RepID=A0A1S3J794_LINAN|nr:fucolectin-4 isoform X2 [Lingula anatina]|eukprot:XP_013406270.1 fucolectin-4 isoform X2 [Lingula anatina]
MIVRGFTYPYNVAMGKTAEQISEVAGAVASRAIDGNVTAYFSAGSCTHTDVTSYPWWRVDLGQEYVIYSVTLFNRGDGGDSGKYLKNVKVEIRNSTYSNNKYLCATHVPQVPRGGSIELSCQVPYIGQDVIVQLQHMAPLILCEVTVKGFKYEECTNEKLGPECKNRCNCRDTNEQCHPVYGVCTSGCAEGWQGHNGTCQVDTSSFPYLTTAPDVTSRTGDSLTISWQKWSPLTGSGNLRHHLYQASVHFLPQQKHLLTQR